MVLIDSVQMARQSFAMQEAAVAEAEARRMTLHRGLGQAEPSVLTKTFLGQRTFQM